jgi:cytochrome oxidase Cu insertion factor (SCO1/SenC/PrrC family)
VVADSAGRVASHPPTRLLVGAGIGAAVLGIGAGVVLHLTLRSNAPAAPALPALQGQAVWASGARRAPNFMLPDQSGRLVSLLGQRGRPVIVAFMDPLCKHLCPIEGRELAAAESQLTPAQRPALLIVSVNPLATGADAIAAARKWGITGDWHWLLGPPEQLSPIWKAYDITVIPRLGDMHSTAIYLVDRKGFERAGFIAPFLPQFVADDLRVLAQPTAPDVR